ncbi:MAG: thiolase family protein [Candidimonas sp.]|nr:MAG: thiolase family protein [Candidimonas sp.]
MHWIEREAYLLDGVRTPFGKYGGALASLDSIELGTCVISEMIRRHPEARHADGALFGVVVQAGLGQNPARIAATRAGVALTTPALTLNSVCLASLESACEAARRIRGGEGQEYLVGGFDSMSRVVSFIPGDDSTAQEPRSALFHDGLDCALTGLSMGVLSDGCNHDLQITREVQDDWAFRSQIRAADGAPIREHDELMVVRTPAGVVTSDQGIRADTSREKIRALKPAFTTDGTITAANASQMSDGASAGLVVSGARLAQLDAVPLARIVDWASVAGPDATLHLQPARAIQKLLAQRRLSVDDIALFEINEAFAGVVVASMRELGLAEASVNVNGGAIALGHPLGATGFRLLLTLALEMRRRKVRRGIATLCGGGGQGLAVLIENDAAEEFSPSTRNQEES